MTFFVIGFIVVASVFVLPESVFNKYELDRTKIAMVGVFALGIYALILIYYHWQFIFLFAVIYYIYQRFIK